MLNLLPNAGFLDGTEGWAGVRGPVLTVLESGAGEAGRAVLRGASAATQDGAIYVLTTRNPTAAPGQVWSFACGVWAAVEGVPVTPTVRLAFNTAAGATVGAAAGTVRPAELPDTPPTAGLPQTFALARGQGTAPALAERAALEVFVVADEGDAVEILLLKPTAGLGALRPGWRWDPGSHAEVDLQRPVWPTGLRPFRTGAGGQPRPWSTAFEGQTGRPAHRPLSLSSARRFDGVMRCDAVQRAALEAFHRETPRGFWFVEPDSDRLCVADFADDGAPRMTQDAGPTCLMSVGLWLETA